jgi:hypothetical protein
LVSMFVVSIPFPPGMLGPTSQSTLQIMEGTHKNSITHYIYTQLYLYTLYQHAHSKYRKSCFP